MLVELLGGTTAAYSAAQKALERVDSLAVLKVDGTADQLAAVMAGL
jgi:hypothetical protein